MSRLVGVGGKLASGKDTLADRLVDEHGWVKLNMSAPLHTAMLALNPWIPVEYRHSSGNKRYADLVAEVGYTEAKENPETRRLLQALGTEVGRNMFGENVWVDIAAHNITELRDQGHDVVITGIRFPNEIEMIHELDGDLLWVERPGSGSDSDHASENLSSMYFDSEVDNSGSIEDLHRLVDESIA